MSYYHSPSMQAARRIQTKTKQKSDALIRQLGGALAKERALAVRPATQKALKAYNAWLKEQPK